MRHRCLDIAGFPVENHWYFAYPQGKQLSPVARALLEFARVEAQRLVAPKRTGVATKAREPTRQAVARSAAP